MTARTLRNTALIGLVVVSFGFAVETAVMGLVLQHQGEPESSIRSLTTLSVCGLMISALACARALFVIRGVPTPPTPPVRPAQRQREKVLAAS
jgi:hypothetical protein